MGDSINKGAQGAIGFFGGGQCSQITIVGTTGGGFSSERLSPCRQISNQTGDGTFGANENTHI